MLRARITIGCWLALAAMFANARADDPRPPRVFEMRTYICHEGKLDALLKRFREHTTGLFEKHGMTNIGYWVPTEGPEAGTTLIYILAYPDEASRLASWKAFRADPVWLAAKEASEKDGPIIKEVISKPLAATDFSAIK